MDRITQNILDRYVKDNSLEGIAEETSFENFTGYLITSTHYQESFDANEIVTGSGQDNGIDGVSIIANGSFISEPEEISDLSANSAYLDVQFICIQSERSSNFDMQKAGHFGNGVQDLFREPSQYKQNDIIKLKKKIIDAIYSNSSKFRNYKPKLFLYYTTTGKWVDDNNLIICARKIKENLNRIGLFSQIEFFYIDADRLQEIDRKISIGARKEIRMEKYSILPETKEIEQSFIGYIDSNEFIKLIETDDHAINPSIFYDNVRDWQELNQVNQEITATIQSKDEQIYFHLLNNGVTIVADSIIQTGEKFNLIDYQIVNGCQTSYSIYENKTYISSTITVPIRLIATKNQDVKNRIIKATNRQTLITDEMLYALSELPKKLESYFETFTGDKGLFFERRPKQYSRNQSIEKQRVINLQTLVRAFASFYLNLPHQTTRNYKALVKNHKDKLFNKTNILLMYYVCCLAYYSLELMYKSKKIDLKLKPAKWHILMCFFNRNVSGNIPRFNSHEMERLCESIKQILYNKTDCEKELLKCAQIVTIVARGNFDRDNIRTEPFTKNVIAQIRRGSKKKGGKSI